MKRRTVTRVVAAVAAVGAALALVACAGIPGSGPVYAGLDDITQTDRAVEFSARGPAAGATQEELVRGFVAAGVDSTDDYAVAREFLASPYDTQWDPHSGVLVVEGTSPYHSEGEGAGTLSLSVTASVDEVGTMLVAQQGQSTDLRFEFVKKGSEWRISAAPAGVILNKTFFSQLWSDQQLAFLGPQDRVVRETRWFLSRTALASEIVRALIEGPSERLKKVVHSGFPPGVKLTNSTVTVIDGRAQVDLTGDGLDNLATQQQILTQLRASLQKVAGLTTVELLIDGSVVRESEEPEPPAPATTGMRPVGVVDGEFGIIGVNGLEPVTGISDEVMRLGPSAISVARSKRAAAVLNRNGVNLVIDGTSTLIDERKGLLAPSIDDDHWVWTVSREAPSQLRVTSLEGESLAITAPWLKDRSVRSVRIAPGGSLISALVTEGQESMLLVAGVIRDNNGDPVGVTEVASTELWASGTAIDFDWVGQMRFTVLTQQSNAGKVTGGGPGLFSFEQGSVAEAEQIVGGGTRAQIRVLSDDHGMYMPQGASGWRRAEIAVQMLAKWG